MGRELKSDHSGIEMKTKVKLLDMLASLKSDHSGIEIGGIVVGYIKSIVVKIRP